MENETTYEVGQKITFRPLLKGLRPRTGTVERILDNGNLYVRTHTTQAVGRERISVNIVVRPKQVIR